MSTDQQTQQGISSRKERNVVLDIAKGLLILLMVIGHSGAPAWLESCIYSFHMPCFFIISGILFSYFYLDKPFTFIKKRVKSIWWPFVKWTWIFLIFHNLFYNIGILRESYTFEQIIYKLFTIFILLDLEQLLGGFWFLRSLFIASIVCFLYYKFIGITPLKLLIGIIILVSIAESIKIFHISYYYFDALNLLACAYFMAGTLLNSVNYKKIKNKSFIITTGIILIGTYGFGEKIEMGNLTAYNLLPYFLSSIIISYSVLLILELAQNKKWTQYLAFLGVKTMDILIIHFLAFRVVSLLKIWIFKLDIDQLHDFPVIKENNSLFWIVYVILGIIICLSYSSIKEYLTNLYYILKNRKDKFSLL